MRVFTVERRVEWGETDAAGIVFYPNIYRWFDAAAHRIMATLGYDGERMRSTGEAFPLVETGARFLRPILFDDVLTVESRITEVRTRAFRLAHRVQRGGDTLAEGHEVRVWARLIPGGIEAIQIPDDVRGNLVEWSM